MGSMLRSALPFFVLLLGVAQPVAASDQSIVTTLVRTGQIKGLDEILRKVRPQIAGDYISAEFDLQTRTYRLRFMNNGNVVNIDVDAQSGDLRQRGHY